MGAAPCDAKRLFSVEEPAGRMTCSYLMSGSEEHDRTDRDLSAQMLMFPHAKTFFELFLKPEVVRG